MKTAKELRDKYDSDLKKLKETCEHPDVSDWMIEEWAPAHRTGWEVRQCNTCWKMMERKHKCMNCMKEFTILEDYYQELEIITPIRQGFCCADCYTNWSESI